MTTLSEPPIAGSQVWDPRTTAGEEPQEAATALSRLAPRLQPTVAPPWLARFQERILGLLANAAPGELPEAPAIAALLGELAPPGISVALELPRGQTIRIERPDPELAQALGYLRALTAADRGETRLPAAVASRCAEILGQLRASVPGLPVPRIAPGPEGMVGMTWETDLHHLNLEVFPDGHVEAFHEDLETGALWSVDRGAGPSTGFLLRLRDAFSAR